MTDPDRSTPLRYGGAALAVLLATAARLALHPALGSRQPFVTLYMAVVLAAWYGGLGPSLLALGLGAVAGAYFLLAPPGPPAVLWVADLLGFALFLAVGSAIIAFGEAGRAARRRLEAEVAERRRAEEALRRGEERLRATLHGIGDAVIATDAGGRVASLNPVAEALTGWEAGEAAGRPLEEVFRLVHEGTGEPVETPAAGVLREGRTVGLADRTALVARDGTRWPIEDSAAPIRDAGGGVAGVVLVFRDVTKRRRAEEALRERERQLRLVTDHAPVLIAHCDPQRRFRFVNRAYAARFGLRPEEVIGRTIPEVLGRRAYAVIEPHIEAALAGRRVEFEADVPYEGLGTLHMQCVYQPETDGDGRVVGWVAAITDVTERKRAERALREAEARLAAVVDHCPATIFLKDREGRYLLVNRRFEELARSSGIGGPYLGRTDAELLPDETAERFRRDDLEVLESGQPKVYEESAEIGGERYTGLTTKFPLLDEAGNVYAVGGISLDITGHKRAEEETRRLALLVEHSHDFIGISDLDLTPTYVNRAGLRMVGLGSLDEARRATVGDFFFPEDRDDIAGEFLPRVLREGHGEVEVRFRHFQTGEAVWVTYHVLTLRDGAGGTTGLATISRDITGRKRAEEALRASEAQFRAVYDQAAVGIAEVYLDGRFLRANARYCEMVGYTQDELLGLRFGDITHPDDPPEHRENFAKIAEGPPGYTIEKRYVRKDGRSVWAHTAVSLIRDGAGRPDRVMAVVEDVSERRRAEERVRFQAHLLDAVGQAVIATDPQGRVTYWNRSAEALYGWAAAEAEGRSILELVVAPESAGRAAEIMGRMLAGEGWSGEFTVRRREGTTFPALVTDTPVFDDRGALEAVIGVSSDITERKRAEELLRDSERRFARFMQHLPGLAWIKDAQGCYVFANDAAERAFGTSRADLYGRTDEEVFPPETAAQFRAHDGRALEAGEGVQVVETLEHDDGVIHHSLVSKFPMPGPDGEAALVGGIAIDITDRMRAEAALRESELRFRGLMEQAPFSVQIFARDGRTLRVNRAWEELWGVTLDQIADYNILEDSQLEAKGVLPQIRRAFAGEPVAVPAIQYDPNETIPDRTRHADPRRWVSAMAYPLRDAAGRVREVVLVHEDITERVRAEESLRWSEERFRHLADAMPQIVWVTRPDGYHEYYNRRWYDYIGCTPEECLGHGWNAPLHPDDRQRSIDRWELALRTGEPYEIEYRFRSKDGEYRWFLARAMPVRDEAGRIVRWFGTCTDIEDIKRSERLLRQSEARYRDAERALRSSQERLMAALSASDTGTFRWEPETGVFLDFDDSLKGLFGLAPDYPVRATEDFIDRVHPDDRTGLEAAVDRSRRGEDFEMEFRVLLPDGGIRWLYDRGKMVRDGGGLPAYLVGACTDITKRKRVEEALQDADRRKDEFLATLAHELRNPLAPIRNALRLMREPGADCDDMEAERAMAERQVVHLARLIDDLMDVARISKGKLELHREVVDLQTIVRQAIQTARTQLDDRRHHLTVSLPEEPIRLEADPTRLEQVFWNLLNNAAKYTEPGGRIDLTAEAVDGQVVVRVRDTGIGIAPDMLPRLFQMFVQVGEHREHAQGGLGIGLGLVRTLVELHGGTITAHSRGPGQGSEFVVRLPLLPAATPEPAPPRGREPGTQAALPRRRILVVDDNVDAAVSLARLLSRLYGQDVRVAHDGPEALEVAAGFRPEVILLDIGLPGMDGHEVARRLRSRPEFKRVQLVALTGWGQEQDRRKSEEAGFDRHLVKPVDPEALRGLLEQEQFGRT